MGFQSRGQHEKGIYFEILIIVRDCSMKNWMLTGRGWPEIKKNLEQAF
jgi:hypothetical protein